MDVIQNSVLIREGRKWKKRWGVLKKVSPENKANHEDSVYYLFIYKDASHAKEGKQKQMYSLFHFCGTDIIDEWDRVKNVFVIITFSQTIYLSFEPLTLQDMWQRVLDDVFGKCEKFDVTIPDKKVMKPGEANIRVYPKFFSIISFKSHKCLNRWLLKNILTYQALSQSVLSFEMISPKGNGSVINLKIPDHAEDVAMLLEKFTNQQNSLGNSSNLNLKDFHGSGVLDDLNQAKRDAGDKNVFTRALLRASNRMKKKRKDKSVNEKKKSRSDNGGEEKFRSWERGKCPQLSVHLDDQTLLNTMQKVKGGGFPKPSRTTSSSSEQQPALPKKNYSSKGSLKSLGTNSIEIDGSDHPIKTRSLTANDISYNSNDHSFIKNQGGFTSADNLPHKSESKLKNSSQQNFHQVPSPSDKSEINMHRQKWSLDSTTSGTLKNPAQRAMEKTRKGSKSKSTNRAPVAPPRSPISLGLEQPKFTFPPEQSQVDSANDSLIRKESDSVSCNSRSSYIDNIQEIADDAFLTNDQQVTLNNNVPHEKSVFDLGMYGRNGNNSNIKVNNKDPLSVENWSLATGDGRVVSISSASSVKQTDYINVSGNNAQSDDDNDSYVNIKQKTKPVPLRLTSYRNEFEKYDDDEDSGVYHPVGPIESNPGSDSMLFTKNPNRSYENLNAATPTLSKKNDYLNLMSPLNKQKTLNYVTVGKIDSFTSRSTSASPVRKMQRSPYETFNSKDYTTIDGKATVALNKSMQDHQRERERMVKTPK